MKFKLMAKFGKIQIEITYYYQPLHSVKKDGFGTSRRVGFELMKFN
jgi:hypothetical protein